MDMIVELVGQARFSQVTGGAVGAADLAQQRGSAAEVAQICQAWGAAIATLHTTSTHHSPAPLAARPWVANVRYVTASTSGGAPRLGCAAVLQAYEASRDLRAAVREVDERWTEHHWIHGDLTATNVQVELRPALRVSFLHLADAGLGDPAWDLATAVDMITWMSPCWRAMPEPLVDYLFLGYRASRRAWSALSGHAGRTGTGDRHLGSERAARVDRAGFRAGGTGNLAGSGSDACCACRTAHGRRLGSPPTQRAFGARPGPWCPADGR
jgi:aminoglycoside phosphotransferase (APT) family kinase protein